MIVTSSLVVMMMVMMVSVFSLSAIGMVILMSLVMAVPIQEVKRYCGDDWRGNDAGDEAGGDAAENEEKD